MSGPAPEPEYVYKVLVDQLAREYRYVRASSIAEAEQHGIVVILVGPADAGREFG